MAEEDIQKLQSEIESLRKENQQLKVAAFQYLENQKNGLHEESLVIDKEPILKVLDGQLSTLKRLNDEVHNLLDGYKEVQKSLGAILPALELQMEGWTNEVQNLKKHIEDSETAYAAVVTQLEIKLKSAQTQLGKTHHHQRIEQLESELAKYKAELELYQSHSPHTGDDKEDPFTNLNIFGV